MIKNRRSWLRPASTLQPLGRTEGVKSPTPPCLNRLLLSTYYGYAHMFRRRKIHREGMEAVPYLMYFATIPPHPLSKTAADCQFTFNGYAHMFGGKDVSGGHGSRFLHSLCRGDLPWSPCGWIIKARLPIPLLPGRDRYIYSGYAH